jgi:molybdate transport system ATP-binding protein
VTERPATAGGMRPAEPLARAAPSPLRADVTVRLGAFALRASVVAPEGLTTAVVGPHGAGASTLVAALAGTLPAEGPIELGGRRIEHLPPEERRLGVVFQDRLLLPHLTALQNVAYPLRARGVPRRRARRRAEALLARLGITAAARARPDRLSGGEATRVALARALAAEPEALVLDEPFAAVHPAERPGVRAALAAELRAFAGPRILATHDPVEALILADRVVVLEHGHVSQAGTPPELRARPATEFVVAFAGLAVIRGRVRRVEGRAVLETAGDPIAVETGYAGEAYAVVRPRSIALYREPPAGSPMNVLRRVVGSVGIEGGRALVALDGEPALTAEVTLDSLRRLALEPGEPVYAVFKATDVDVWPAS